MTDTPLSREYAYEFAKAHGHEIAIRKVGQWIDLEIRDKNWNCLWDYASTDMDHINTAILYYPRHLKY